MGRIRQLNEQLATLIAAGEVITGPAAVVRELIDNSLDAAATSIEIALLEGGLRSIRVADDGVGMDDDDAVLCLSTHATSKISAADDLEDIGTLGFRGEALAAILAVSRLRLESRTEGAPSGVMVRGMGGDLLEVRPVARRRGTTVEVSGLFFNTPARREFQDTPRAEGTRVLQVVQRAALANPGVRFTLHEAGRELLDLAPAGELLERVRQLYGAEFAGALIPVAGRRGDVSVTGFVSHPSSGVRRARRNAFAVNGRAFESFEIRRLLTTTFSPLLTGGTHVEAILRVALPRRDVDVNVSPDKSQVRFRRPGQVLAAVHDALQSALAEQEGIVRLAAQGRDAEFAAPPPPPSFLPFPPSPPRPHHGLPVEPDGLMQLNDSFLLCPTPRGLLIVDQHSAHERVHYERLRERLVRLGQNPDVQALIFPEPLHLDVQQAALLEEMQPFLRRLGFDIVPGGPRQYLVQGCPGALGGRPLARTIERLMDGYLRSREAGATAREVGAHLAAVEEQMLRTVACHAAVKAGQRLAESEIRSLWDALVKVDLAGHDVHGRPAILLLENGEIARRLGRSGPTD